MSFIGQALLEGDNLFRSRVRAGAIAAALDRDNDQNTGIRATAFAVLQDQPNVIGTFVSLTASKLSENITAYPGDSSVDSSGISDDQIKEQIAAYFGVVSNIYFPQPES